MKPLLFLPALLFSLSGFADGKMYSRALEKIPVGIPYQRALILHHGQTQTLLLQSQYQLPKDAEPEELAWVIPLPSVPEVGAGDQKIVDRIFFFLDWDSSPGVTKISSYIYLYAAPVCTLVFLLAAGFQKPGSRRRETFFRISFYAGLITFLMAIMMPSFSRARSGGSSVEVVVDKQVGIYAVKVIRAEDGASIADWLSEHGFSFAEVDRTYFENHSQSGGCFVTARVNLSNGEKRDFAREGLTDPLLFQFETPKPFYPLALTGSAEVDTTVLIYLYSSMPYLPKEDLTLRFSGDNPRSRSGNMILNYFAFLSDESPDTYGVFRLPEETFGHLMKFKATLTPEQMQEDLRFEPAPDLPDFREHVVRW